MKAGRIVGPRKVEILDVSVPELRDGEVRIQVEHACLCGSDIPLFCGDFDVLKQEGKGASSVFVDYGRDVMYPMDLGLTLHECVGSVTESRSRRFREGDFVLGVPVRQHGFFEYLTLPETRVYPMPDGPVSKEEILMSQPLGTILYGFRKLPDVKGKVAAVIGQGPIGLMMNAVLAHRGARRVVGIDRIPARAAVGERMGATDVINSSVEDPVKVVRSLTDGVLAEIVIEAAGHHELAIDLAVDLVSQDGHILQFGVTDYAYSDQYPAGKLFYKNASLHHSVDTRHEEYFVEAARMIADSDIDVKLLLTHRFKVEDAQQAFETYADRLDGALKVLLEF